MELKGEEQDSGKRLDLFLAFKLPKFSRSQLKSLITSEKVEVNGGVEFHPQYRVKPGDVIRLNSTPEIKQPNKELELFEYELDILFESEHVLAVNKPAGMVSHPAPSHPNNTLANAVKYYLRQSGQDRFGNDRAGLIHRLDAPTSGAILFAKSPQGLWYISQQFANRQVNKYYLALVRGELSEDKEINMPIGRDRINRKKYSPRTNKPRRARTIITPLQRSGDKKSTLVLAKPVTGRTHQIRVHLAESNHPIIGDGIYGKIRNQRLMLHAYAIELGLDPNKPETKEKIVAPLDRAFIQTLKRYKIDSTWQEKLTAKLSS